MSFEMYKGSCYPCFCDNRACQHSDALVTCCVSEGGNISGFIRPYFVHLPPLTIFVETSSLQTHDSLRQCHLAYAFGLCKEGCLTLHQAYPCQDVEQDHPNQCLTLPGPDHLWDLGNRWYCQVDIGMAMEEVEILMTLQGATREISRLTKLWTGVCFGSEHQKPHFFQLEPDWRADESCEHRYRSQYEMHTPIAIQPEP